MKATITEQDATGIITSMKRVAKPHRCYWCTEQIARRENSMVIDIQRHYFYYHPECHAAYLRSEETTKSHIALPFHKRNRGETIEETTAITGIL